MMSKYKLHPISAAIEALKSLKSLIVPGIILIAANGFNFTVDFRDEDFWGSMFSFLILLVIFLFTTVAGILKWLTFRYWFEEGELRVQYGLIVKKKRYILFDRIQSLNYKEGVFHRLFGLVQVTVETAASTDGKPEASLTAIKRVAADQIEKEMNQAKYGEITQDDDMLITPKSRKVYKMSAKDLILLATTSSGVGVVVFGVLAVVSQFAEYIPYDWIYDELAYLVKYSVIIVIALILMGMLAAWIISIALTLLNYYDFTVVEENKRLVITRGLLEKKRIAIPLNRVQAIKIVENPLRQPFGLASVQLESAGGGFEEGKSSKIVLFPLISKKAAVAPFEELFPQFDFEVQSFIQSPKRAKPFFYRLDFLWIAPLTAVLTYFFFPYGLLVLLLAIPMVAWGKWQHKAAAVQQAEQQLTIVSRTFSRVTFYVQKNRIQAMEQRQSFFQKRRDIASLKVTVMSGMHGATAIAYHMDQSEIESLMEWYRHTKKAAIEQDPILE